MDVIDSPYIVENFLRNREEAENYLKQYGESGKDKNNGVTLSYEHIAKLDPLFVWFSAATIGSIQVGKTIDLVNYPVLSHCESTKTLSLGFSYGNQQIHNNVVALYNTYQDHGIEGLRKLHEFDDNAQYISLNALKAFQTYSELQSQAKSYASQVGLSAKDPAVIHHVLSQNDNIELLRDATSRLVQHEQVIVQPMYNNAYLENPKTVGETLNDSSYIEKLIANKIELAGAKILDKYISTDGYDFSSYDQRIAYFNKVFDEYFTILAQEDGLERLIGQRENMVASLDAEFIAYGEHFQNADKLTMSIADASNENHLLDGNYAFTWDNTTNQWRIVTELDVPKLPGGMWVSPDTYPEVMNIVNNFPLIENTFFYDSSSNQSYVFCKADFLPNLPPNYTWASLKTYMEPSQFGYENGGSIWTLSKINSSSFSDSAVNANNLTLAQVIDFSNDSLQTLLNTLTHQDTQHLQKNPSIETFLPSLTVADVSIAPPQLNLIPNLVTEALIVIA